MMITEALKNLYKAVTGAEQAPTDDQIADLVQSLADNWPASGAYTLPVASSETIGGVKQVAEVTFVVESATAETCATAIKSIVDGMKAAGMMA